MTTSPSVPAVEPSAVDKSTRHLLLRQILKQVSRSFYLSLVVLPRPVREQVSLAYLFCRAADTIADTRLIPRAERLQSLQTFRQSFQESPSPARQVDLDQMLEHLTPHQGSEGERQLMRHLPSCFQLFRHMSKGDQQLIRELVMTLTQGMEMDLQRFPTEADAMPCALADAHDLDRYTYYVAGVVGEFWTKIHMAHLPALGHLDIQQMCTDGIRFGKGLQMTNILKDMAADLQIGRCYVPERYLEACGLTVLDLKSFGAQDRFEPVLHRLIREALGHLDSARDYLVNLPWRLIRLRLSCMWPLLFAVQTMEAIARSTTLLEPDAKVKISRRTVYQTMLRSLWCLASRQGFESYYQTLRSRVEQSIRTRTGET